MKTIRLTRGAVALVDNDDYERVSAYKWRLQVVRHCQYAISGDSPHAVYMHRLIALAPSATKIDHIDGDGLNNQKSNLRHSTHSENMRNRTKHSQTSSQFKGVWRDATRWRAEIRVDGVRMKLGSYSTEVDAAHAYNQAAIKYHGQFAHTNSV